MTHQPKTVCPKCGGKKGAYAKHCIGCRQSTKHGLSYTPEYRAWQQMRLRCTDPKHAAFKDYGARGIDVCPQWLDSPEQFLRDMGKKPSPKHEIDRIDNDKGYSPENCRWTTRSTNDRNRRSNRMLAFRGETRALVEWCEILGLPRDTIRKRLEADWSIEKALTTPVRAKAPNGSAANDRGSQAVAA